MLIRDISFQQTNIVSGGKGNDRVKISVQDNSGNFFLFTFVKVDV
jgi:hypothetical protein